MVSKKGNPKEDKKVPVKSDKAVKPAKVAKKKVASKTTKTASTTKKATKKK
jgi:hypothetical protein